MPNMHALSKPDARIATNASAGDPIKHVPSPWEGLASTSVDLQHFASQPADNCEHRASTWTATVSAGGRLKQRAQYSDDVHNLHSHRCVRTNTIRRQADHGCKTKSGPSRRNGKCNRIRISDGIRSESRSEKRNFLLPRYKTVSTRSHRRRKHRCQPHSKAFEVIHSIHTLSSDRSKSWYRSTIVSARPGFDNRGLLKQSRSTMHRWEVILSRQARAKTGSFSTTSTWHFRTMFYSKRMYCIWRPSSQQTGWASRKRDTRNRCYCKEVQSCKNCRNALRIPT
jgi:hypothetical protein